MQSRLSFFLLLGVGVADDSANSVRAAVRIGGSDEVLIDENSLALITGSEFENGTIEWELSGDTALNAPAPMVGPGTVAHFIKSVVQR